MPPGLVRLPNGKLVSRRKLHPKSSDKPTYVTKPGPGAAETFKKTQQHAKELHNEAKAKRLGVPYLGKPPKAKSAGLFGHGSKYFTEQFKKANQDIIGIPYAGYSIGKALTLDTADLVRHPARPQYRRTEKIAKAIGKQTAQTVRHPGRDLFQSATLALPAAGAVGRVGEVSSALGRGESVTSALRRPSLARTQKFEGADLKSTSYHRGAAARVGQKVLEKRNRGVIPTNTRGVNKATRILGQEKTSLGETRRASLNRLTKTYARVKPTTPEETAVTLSISKTPVKQAIDFEKEGLAKETARMKRLQKKPQSTRRDEAIMRTQQKIDAHAHRGALLKEVQDSKYLSSNEHGLPVLDASHKRFAKLAKLEADQRAAVLESEGHALKRGLTTQDTLAGRREAPRLQVHGKYEGFGATPATRPRTLEEAKAHLDKLDKRIEKITKPVIERMYQENRDAYDLKAGLSGGKARGTKEIPKDVQLPRYKRGGQLNVQKMNELRQTTPEAEAKALKAPRRKQTAKQLAEQDFWNNVATKDHPTVRKLRELNDEANRLRSDIAKHEEPAFMREGAPPDLGTVEHYSGEKIKFKQKDAKEIRSWKDPIAQNILKTGLAKTGAGLQEIRLLRSTRGQVKSIASIVEDESNIYVADIAARAESGAGDALGREILNEAANKGKGVTMTTATDAGRHFAQKLGLHEVGKDSWEMSAAEARQHGFTATSGAGYAPEILHQGATGPAVYRGGLPNRKPLFGRMRTGKSLETGLGTPHGVRATIQNMLGKQRFYDIHDYWGKMVSMGREVRPADTRGVEWVPVKKEVASSLSARMLKEHEDMLKGVDPEHLTPEQAARIEATDQKFRDQYFPQDLKTNEPGFRTPGYVWVPKKLLDPVKPGIGRIPVMDEMNAVMRGIILYKPGYIAPNLVGNMIYNFFQQGVFMPRNWNAAARMGQEAADLADASMGSGVAKSIFGEEKGGKLPRASKYTQKTGDFYGKFVDVWARRSALVHAMRQEGLKTDDSSVIKFLKRDDGEVARVVQRARDAIIDYERLGSREKTWVRRILFIYPWLKGSTVYTAQFALEHPLQAAVYANIGHKYAQKAEQEIGPIPAWAEGLFPIGKQHGGNVLAINPMSISPFGQTSQIAQAGASLVQGVPPSEKVGQMLTPGLQAAITAAYGRDLFTGEQLKGGAIQNFAEGLSQSFPEITYAKRLQGQTGKTYPYGKLGATGAFFLGSPSPRPVNTDYLHKSAEQDMLNLMSPQQRLQYHAEKDKTDTWTRLQKRYNVSPKTKQALEQAYTRRSEVDLMRHNAHEAAAGDKTKYARESLKGELALAAEWGLIEPLPPAALARFDSAPLEDLTKLKSEVERSFMQKGYGQTIHDMEKLAGKP
jgi:hypothetical protein